MALAWMSVMFTFSTDTFSAAHTSRFIVPVLHWLFPHASDATIDLLHEFVRKCAHVFEYSVLSVLLFRAVRAPRQGWQFKWAAIALLLAVLFACSDEYHQTFVPSRGPSVHDVALDAAAAATMQLLLWLYFRRSIPVSAVTRGG